MSEYAESVRCQVSGLAYTVLVHCILSGPRFSTIHYKASYLLSGNIHSRALWSTELNDTSVFKIHARIKEYHIESYHVKAQMAIWTMTVISRQLFTTEASVTTQFMSNLRQVYLWVSSRIGLNPSQRQQPRGPPTAVRPYNFVTDAANLTVYFPVGTESLNSRSLIKSVTGNIRGSSRRRTWQNVYELEDIRDKVPPVIDL